MFPLMSHVYKTVVIIDIKSNTIIGAGSVVIEKKFIRNQGTVGNSPIVA